MHSQALIVRGRFLVVRSPPLTHVPHLALGHSCSLRSQHGMSTHIDLGPLHVTFVATNPTTIVTYSLLNVLIHSILPLPVSGLFWVAAVVLYGAVNGFLLALFTSAFGCYLALLITRWFRPCILRMLGDYEESWHSLDRAIVHERWKIPLLVRSTPIMPVVPTNFMLALTSVDDWTYTWTVTVGMVPAGLPYAYGAVVGEAVLEEFPPKDPLLLAVAVVGLLATTLAVYKIGAIAANELDKHGIDSPRTPKPQQWGSSRDLVAQPQKHATPATSRRTGVPILI